MKKTLLIASLLCCSTLVYHVHAQGLLPDDPEGLLFSTNGGVHKTTGIASRLISVGSSQFIADVFQTIDTTFYSYSGGRGYNAKSKNWDYDIVERQQYIAATNTYDKNGRATQLFDASGNDTTITDEYWTGTAWANMAKKLCAYNPSNYIDTEIRQDWNTSTSQWTNRERYVYAYNAINKITQKTYFIWNSAINTWQTDRANIYTYNSSGDMISADALTWNAGSSKYDSSGRALYVYDLYHQPTSQTIMTRDITTGTWLLSGKVLYSNYVRDQPGRVTNLRWNGSTGTYDSSYRNTYTYNSYNQVTSYTTENYSSGKWNYAYAYRYYYELYTSAVEDKTILNSSVIIYPVPAKNEITVDVNYSTPQSCTVTIVDMNGRTVAECQMPVNNNHHKIIPVSKLANGNYLVKVTGVAVNTTKQIVVNHE